MALAVFFTSIGQAPAEAETLTRADGSAINYHLQGTHEVGRRGLLLMLQGSGCEPVAERSWIKSEPPMIAPGYAVLAIDKYGVSPNQRQSGFVEGCSSDYWARNTLQQRVLDALQVVASLRGEPWWNRKLIIYGGSEGGAVAALLAPLMPETKAVVIVSSGIGVSVGELIRAATPPPVALQIPKILVEAKANPTGHKHFGGASYRWWADAADVTPAKALLQSDAPILLIHGGRDQLAPVATARATRDMFAAARKTNLTYREFETYDHSMKGPDGVDRRPLALREAGDWLKRQGAALSSGEEAAAPVLDAIREALAAEARLPPAKTDREKLERMGVLDQAGRARINVIPWASLPPEEALQARMAIAAALAPIDQANVRELLKLLPKEGWFTREKYGDRATAAAFHILQHSRDVETKRRVLPYIEAAARRGDIEGSDYASMFDRLATSQGRPQRYGTQFRCVSGKIEPFPLEDTAAVERLRTELRLRQTFAESERMQRGRPCG